ncbi:MAG: hypothetical protein ACTSPI_04280 [Candidatus Heimdallarchaeaceae archaeon]
MSKLTSAYIAGFVDADGSIIFSKRKQGWYTYELCVTNTNKNLIDWFHKSFGGHIFTKTFNDGQNWKKQYWWRLYNKELLSKFLLKIIPYLKIKKKQAQILRKVLATYDKDNYEYSRDEKGRIKTKKPNKKVLEFREKSYLEMKKLNQRGYIVQPERLSEETLLKEKRQSELIGKKL